MCTSMQVVHKVKQFHLPNPGPTRPRAVCVSACKMAALLRMFGDDPTSPGGGADLSSWTEVVQELAANLWL